MFSVLDDYLMNVKESLIYRCNKSSNPKIPFLITSESIGDLSSMVNIDIISLRDIKSQFLRKKAILHIDFLLYIHAGNHSQRG